MCDDNVVEGLVRTPEAGEAHAKDHPDEGLSDLGCLVDVPGWVGVEVSRRCRGGREVVQ